MTHFHVSLSEREPIIICAVVSLIETNPLRHTDHFCTFVTWEVVRHSHVYTFHIFTLSCLSPSSYSWVSLSLRGWLWHRAHWFGWPAQQCEQTSQGEQKELQQQQQQFDFCEPQHASLWGTQPHLRHQKPGGQAGEIYSIHLHITTCCFRHSTLLHHKQRLKHNLSSNPLSKYIQSTVNTWLLKCMLIVSFIRCWQINSNSFFLIYSS